jgi:hypothetical protein
MNGILCAYLRATEPSTPSVDATALQPPSIASLTMFSGSKYAGSARTTHRGVLDALIDRQNRHVAGARQAPVSSTDCRLPARAASDRTRVERDRRSRARQMQAFLRNRLALMLEQRTSSPGVEAMPLRPETAVQPRSHLLIDFRSYHRKANCSMTASRRRERQDRRSAAPAPHVRSPRAGPRQWVARRKQRAAVLVGNDRDRIVPSRIASAVISPCPYRSAAERSAASPRCRRPPGSRASATPPDRRRHRSPAPAHRVRARSLGDAQHEPAIHDHAHRPGTARTTCC